MCTTSGNRLLVLVVVGVQGTLIGAYLTRYLLAATMCSNVYDCGSSDGENGHT